MEKLYTIKEVTDILCVTRQAIYQWNKKGILKFVRVNGNPRITESELKKLVKED